MGKSRRQDGKGKRAEAIERVESEGFGGFWDSCVNFCLHVKSKKINEYISEVSQKQICRYRELEVTSEMS